MDNEPTTTSLSFYQITLDGECARCAYCACIVENTQDY